MCGGCEPDRQLVPNSHDGKVPEVINFVAKVDSTPTRKMVIRLTWAYDTLKYPTDRDKANLKDWDVQRSVGDTTFFQSRGRTLFPSFSDSSNEVQPLSKDVVLYYRVDASGFTDFAGRRVQYDGKPSDILEIIIKKR